ncbi:hypothetical protein GFS24_01640 [Chitinophaga sp. SYP-B3965]|uniref:DUF6242 domain-containing protein n=1 Tax=Chitinophaga sp. SYP-B3965 TaxID=2663120 RepID=UPI0012996AF8|nr:DUF6242 domain-containing protein [Chitinophaga sp. SYP-B3965]MRG43793.1 hypothetical protein [Chitinophaga sp. SYP-B3965]
MSKVNHYLFILLMAGLFIACKKEDKRGKLAGITEFSIPSVTAPFTVDHSLLKVWNVDSLPFQTNVSALVATFVKVPGAIVKVGTVVQESGVTLNNFTSPVVYTVTSEDGATVRNYTVQVNVAKLDPKAVAWQKHGDATFGSFHDVQAGFFNGKFYAFGATLNPVTFGAFQSDNATTWTRLLAADNNGDSIPKGEHGKLVTGFKNKIWLLGGLLPGSGFTFSAVTNKVWSSSDGLTWTASSPAVATDRWSARERINAVVFKEKLWVIGGNGYPSFGNANSYGTAFNDVWNTEDGNAWTQITAAAQFPPRRNPAVFVYKEKIWVVGGLDNGNVYKNDIWNSADGITWTQVTQVNAAPLRQGHQIVVHRNQLLLISGENAGVGQSDLWVSEDDGVNWTKVAEVDPRALPAQFPARIAFSAFVNNNIIWIIGGTGRTSNPATYPNVIEIWKGGLN